MKTFAVLFAISIFAVYLQPVSAADGSSNVEWNLSDFDTEIIILPSTAPEQPAAEGGFGHAVGNVMDGLGELLWCILDWGPIGSCREWLLSHRLVSLLLIKFLLAYWWHKCS